MVLRLRTVVSDDFESIRKLAPDREEELRLTPGTLQAAVVLSDDSIVAYGAIKVFAELVLAVNRDHSKLARAESIARLLGFAERFCRERPIEELHTFADERHAEFLKRHFGFQDVLEKPLVLPLE